MSMPQLLEVDNTLIAGDEEEGYTLICMLPDSDPEQKNIFMQYCVENDCTIYKIYWVSRFDRNVVEEIEPIIYDAYRCVVQAKNDDIFKLLNVRYLYAKRLNAVKHLEKCLAQGGITKTCMEIEHEKNPINCEKLASSILASLYHPQ